MADNKLAELYVEVKAKTDKLEKDLDALKSKTTKSAGEMSKGMDGVGKSILKIGATFFTFQKLNQFIQSSIAAFKGQEQAIAQLDVALGRHSTSLIKYASELQNTTIYGDEVVVSAMASIAAFTKEETSIKRLTQAATDLATAKGIDLASAADLIAKSFGTSTNALKRQGVEVEGLAGSTERLNSIVTNISNLYGGQASAQAQTYTGKLTQLENKVSDLQESIGENLARSFSILGITAIPVLDDINKHATKGNYVIGRLIGLLKGEVSFKDFFKDFISDTDTVIAKMETLDKAREFQNIKTFTEKQRKELNEILKILHNPNIKITPSGFEKLNDQLDAFQKKYNVVFGKTGNSGNLGGTELTNVEQTIKAYTDLKKSVKEYQDAVSNETNPELKAILQLNLDDLQKQLNEIEIKAGLKVAPQDANSLFKEMDDEIKKGQDALESQEFAHQENLKNIRQSAQDEFISRLAATNEAAYELEKERIDADLQQMIEAGVAQEEASAIHAEKMKELDNAVTDAKLQNIAEIAGAMNGFASLAEALGGKQTTAYKAMAITEATIATYLAATKALAEVPFPFNIPAMAGIIATGLANVANISKAHSGGVFENGKKIAKFAGGGDFVVPGGFPNDTFPMLVESGERVSVTPRNKVGNESQMFNMLGKKLDAVNRNLAVVQQTIKEQELAVNIDSKKLVKNATKPAENRLRKSGVNLDVL